ncbi:MAG: tetratricopeptide repeat protein [Prevotellaceae bacterium]|nr:tetratricopeptide repeat protein [Prevotellaceae bacterium]
MSEDLKVIRAMIDKGETDSAIAALNDNLSQGEGADDEAYYLLGNAYRKQGDWQHAIDNYLEATALNPESPAAGAREMLMDILNFYNKDMYNQ